MLATAICLSLSPAPLAPTTDGPQLLAAPRAASDTTLELALDGCDAPAVRLFAALEGDALHWIDLGTFPAAADGSALLRLPAPAGLPAVRLCAAWPTPAGASSVQAVSSPSGARLGGQAPPNQIPVEHPQGDLWDFDWGFGGLPLAPGDVVSDTQPWSFFATVSGRLGARTRDVVLVAQAPTTGNAYGSVLSVEPPSFPTGATRTLRIEFPEPTFVASIIVADVLGSGGELRGYDGAVQTGSTPVPDLGGSGSAWVQIPVAPLFTALELELPGPGGFAEIQVTPHRMLIDFDHSTTGVPLGLQPGGQVGHEYAGIGIFGDVYAENANPGHPDLPILFDSAAPTGGDTDLATPGYGLGNRVARGNVLIIAENDLDLDGDPEGLVDIPDDEAAGGVLRVGFITNSVIFRSATVMDVDDEGPSFVRVFSGPNWVDFPLENLGDNSVQTVFGELSTRQVELHLSGSGALVELQFDPINF